MRIRNLTDCNYDQSVFGIKFEKGVSLGHLNQNQLDKIQSFGLFQFEVLEEPCLNCNKLENEIILLKDQLSKKKK